MKRMGLCALLGAAIFCGVGTVRAEEPNLHFGFLTDTHVLDDDASYDCVRLALALFREKGVSLIAHGGDVSTHNVVERYQKYKSIFDETFAGVTPPVQLTAVGNHDSFWKVGGTDQTASVQLENSVRMLETLGVANTHTDKKVIGGYTFLIMPWAIGKTGFIGWTEYESMISQACAENPGKPVFLLEHEPPQDTIYNSHNWGNAKKRTILDKYPQIIELSGHVHGSLRNDQYIWQGAFSILNGGCLTTWNGLLNGASASDPKPAYEVLTVDVYDDRIVAHRWNIHDKAEIDPENPWTIPLPFAAATAPYNREKLVANEVPAAFPAAAEVSVTADEANVAVSFPETSGNVMTYMITVKDGASTVSAREIFADYWREPSARTGTASLAFPLSGFAAQKDYTFEVQPVGQYGARGAAISQTWRSAAPVEEPDYFVEYVESDGSTFVDTEIIGKSGTKAEIDMLFPSSGGTAELGANCAILGARKDSGETRLFLFHTSNPSGSKALFTYGYGTYTRTDSPLAAGVRYHMESTLEVGKQVLCLNGNTVVQETSKTSIDTGKNLYLFACNYQSKAQYPLKARCYSLKIWQTDANGDYWLVRNFRPCVKDNVAGLYDYVSGKIFYGHSTSKLTTLRNLTASPGAFNEEPNLHFGFLTDTHVLDDDASYDNVRLALALFREKGVSLIAHGGDVSTHNVVARYQKYKSIFDETFAGVTPPVQLTAVGNHDSYWKKDGMDQDVSTPLETSVRMLETLGVANKHTDKMVIGGYTFLIMPYSVNVTGFVSWSDYETAVATACAENPGKPVFLLEHEPPQDTIYNSHDWGNAKRRAILDKYPQIVELSGHVHGSLRNDQYIWQGAFTMINGGCLSTWNGLLNGAAATDPKPAYEVLTVDVYDDRIVAHRWNIHDKTEIDPENPWTIPLPFAAATAPYNREALVANEVPAEFPATAEVSVTADEANVTVSFPETTGNVMTYMITVKDGATTVATREIFSDFWREPSARTGTASLAFPLTGFAAQKDYTFEVQPVGQYGARGAAISQTWRSTSLVDAPDYFIEYVESDGSTFVDTEVIGRSGTKMETDLMYTEIGGDLAYIGSRKSGTDTRVFPFHCNGSAACLGYKVFRQSGTKLSANVKYHVASTLEPGNQKLYVDEAFVSTEQVSGEVDNGYNMYLFALNLSDSANNCSKVRCYGLKLWQTDANGDYQLVRDFRPCIKDNVAGLYDYVSGRIFYGHSASTPANRRNLKASTGAFDTLTVKGKPDRFVEFVSSDGQQIIDTGLPARSGLKAWADMKWLGDYAPSSGTEFSLLSAQNKSNEGVYLIHDSYNKNNATDGGRVHRVRFICGTGFWPMHEDGKSYTWEFHGVPRDNPRITVEGDFTDPANITYSVNGEPIPVVGEGGAVDTGLNLTMFGANFSDKSSDPARYRSKVRLYGLKLWLDGKLARDFSPCLKDGRAGLYDAVNDEILFPYVPFPLSGVGTAGFVDYVESDGSNYVNTEVVGKSGTKMAADLMYRVVGGDLAYIGSRKSKSSIDRFFPFHCNASVANIGYADFVKPSPAYAIAKDVKYHVETTLEHGNQTLDVNGTRVYTGANATAIDNERDMYLFAVNLAGVANYMPKARSYGLKLWQTDETGDYQLVRDFHPCVTYMLSGDCTAGLYDTVSKRIFSSAATGPLLFGNDADSVKGRPDKYVEYIQVSGFQTLDTGVPARTGVKAEGDFAFWSDLGVEQCYLGSQKDDCLRMINLKTDPTNPALTPQFWSAFGNAAVGAGYLEYPDGSRAACEKGVKYHFSCDWTDPAHATLDLNGQRVMDAANVASPSSGDTLGLFACRTGTGYLYRSCARCYGLKLWLDGKLVRDFVPCVKDGRGALFDRGTRRCYFPQGANITEDNVGPQVPGPGFQILVR